MSMMKVLGIAIIIGGFGASVYLNDFWSGFAAGLVSVVAGGYLILKG